jgi:DNA adenine methylase
MVPDRFQKLVGRASDPEAGSKWILRSRRMHGNICKAIESNGSSEIPTVLKWPGGKLSHIGTLLTFMQRPPCTYYEPFFGSGALFFSLKPERAVLGDSNSELMEFYSVLRDKPGELIKSVSKHPNERNTYYKIRKQKPQSALGRASRMLYLNRTCFNGLFRTNRKGEFNVPFGSNGRPVSPGTQRIMSASAALATAELKAGDFEKICENAGHGDGVFFDPPYAIKNSGGGFVLYNPQVFSWEDQLRLKRLSDQLIARGAWVLQTNVDHPSIRALYHDYRILEIGRRSALAASSRSRGLVRELLIIPPKQTPLKGGLNNKIYWVP